MDLEGVRRRCLAAIGADQDDDVGVRATRLNVGIHEAAVLGASEIALTEPGAARDARQWELVGSGVPAQRDAGGSRRGLALGVLALPLEGDRGPALAPVAVDRDDRVGRALSG